ncbi:hypothetical protein C0J52_10810 [Blattella germanica]|nr:hypothetical protein C0J52_10810 [Blattella germanica]
MSGYNRFPFEQDLHHNGALKIDTRFQRLLSSCFWHFRLVRIKCIARMDEWTSYSVWVVLVLEGQLSELLRGKEVYVTD